MIYWTTESIFQRKAFLENLWLDIDDILLYFFTFLSKILFNKRLTIVKIKSAASSGVQGKLTQKACSVRKDTARVGKFYVYYGNTAVDLDPLPVSRARLTVVELTLFEWDVFEWQRRSKFKPTAKCVPSYDSSTQKLNIQNIFTNKLLLFRATL